MFRLHETQARRAVVYPDEIQASHAAKGGKA
jgi:hypothetical protein